jgi:hypothetical protein
LKIYIINIVIKYTGAVRPAMFPTIMVGVQHQVTLRLLLLLCTKL